MAARMTTDRYLDPHHVGQSDDDYTTGFEPTSFDTSGPSFPSDARGGAGREPRPVTRVSPFERERIRLGLAEFLDRYPE